ncbi:MAG: hypothetical protein ACOYU7_10165 [Bacillota bacterium]
MEKALQQILEKLTNIDSRLSNLEKGQEALHADVSGLQEGQARLEKGQEVLRMDVTGLQEGQARLEKGQEVLRTDVGRLEKGQQRLELRLEHEVIEKVKVLFDAHSLYLDFFESIKDSQARTEESLELVYRRLIELDNRQISQERELRLLRVRKDT